MGSSINNHFVGHAIHVSHLAEILIFGLHSKKIMFFGNSFFTIHICQELFQAMIASYMGHPQWSGQSFQANTLDAIPFHVISVPAVQPRTT